MSISTDKFKIPQRKSVIYSKDGSATTTPWTVKADWSVCVTAPSFHTVTQQLLSGNSSGIEAASVIRKLSYQFSFMWWCQFEHLWSKLQTPRGVFYFWENTAQSGETTEVSCKIWISDVSFNINWIAVVFPFFFPDPNCVQKGPAPAHPATLRYRYYCR